MRARRGGRAISFNRMQGDGGGKRSRKDLVKVNQADGLIIGHDVQDKAVGARKGQSQVVLNEELLSKVAAHIGGDLADIVW